MENEQFSAVFKWVFFLFVISRNSKQKAAMSLYEGSFRSFRSQKEKKRFQLNWFWKRRCLLPVYCPIEKCVRVCCGGVPGQAGWLQFYEASVWPRLALIDFCVDICALGYRHSRRSLPPFACLGTLCRPARGLPQLPLYLPPTRLSTASVLCLWCHNKRIMLPLVECESLPLVCQLPFVFAFLLARRTVCLAVQFSTVVV